jgi:23S rRNA pseudouridine1911/1915/1917 synthase
MAAMLEARSIVVGPEYAGERLDSLLRRELSNLSRAARAELIAAGGVRVNGRVARKGAALAVGDRVEISALSAEAGPAPDGSLALQIVFEDRDLVAVDKPAGIPSHALRPGERGTVASWLLARYPEMAGVGYRALEAGLLHRLDTETSGILVAARHAEAFARLRAAHERDSFQKHYLALVSGRPKPQLAQAFLRADSRKVRVELDSFARAKLVVSELVSAEVHGEFSLVCVRVTRAARHQVRAHLARLGHPIAGDELYGGASVPGLRRHFLHASELELPHPSDGRKLQLRAELAADLREVLASLPLTAAKR